MIAENSDRGALIAQADIHRLYTRVVQPALAEFVPTDDVFGVEATDMETFLKAARVDTHNELCHEMRRAFALIVGALFERQLQSWLSGKMPFAEVEGAQSLPALLKLVDKVDSSIKTKGFMSDLNELCLVANAVRHGSGRSARDLQNASRRFWDHQRLKAGANGPTLPHRDCGTTL
ncbi:MAG: hypothetical protein ACRD3N_11985 [Terracidiphilus sp.]